MKVLHVCAYTAQYGGNFIASLKALEHMLNQQGVITEYLFPDSVKNTMWCKELERHAKVSFAGLNRFQLSTFQEVRQAMKDVDIIHSHFELYDCITAIALSKKQKLVWHLHDSFDNDIDIPHRVINKFQYGFLGKKAWLVSPSRYYADYVVKLGFPASKVCIVANCIALDRLNRNISIEKKCNFLVFGGFYRIKGLDVLLDACRMLIHNGKSFTLGVVGYDETWSYLHKYYADIEDNVIKIAPNENVSELYNSASVFLSTSRRESFSYALLEAIYMGMPAIISDIPGTKWASQYQSVLQFESENATELAKCMEKYLAKDFWFSDRDIFDASCDVATRYNQEKWSAAIKGVYFDVYK